MSTCPDITAVITLSAPAVAKLKVMPLLKKALIYCDILRSIENRPATSLADLIFVSEPKSIEAGYCHKYNQEKKPYFLHGYIPPYILILIIIAIAYNFAVRKLFLNE